MASAGSNPSGQEQPESLYMPAPTVWPAVMATGVALLAAGLVTNLVVSLVGIALLVTGLVGWMRQLLSSAGEVEEALAPPEQRPRPVTGVPGQVEPLSAGMPGFRLQVPEKYHPYSAGIRGGIVGGLAMPIPALAYGLVSGHGIWFPINLLAGMLLPSVAEATVRQLEQFSLLGLVLGTVIHAVFSVSLGLMYGVLLPMLPRAPLLWGGIVMPLLWSGASHGLMGVVNPALREHVYWPAFVASQLVYGIVAGLVVQRSEQVYVRQIQPS